MQYIITHNGKPMLGSTVLAALLNMEHTEFLQKLDDLVRLPHSTLDENLEQLENGKVLLNQNAFIYVINNLEMDFMKTINFPSAEIHEEFNQFDKQAVSTINAQTPLTVEEAKLVTEINLLNDQSIQHRNLSLIYAAKTGAKLIEAKELVGHGNFIFWLNQHCTMTRQHANNIMNLARAYPELLSEDVNVKSTLHKLDVTKAIALMTASETVKQDVMLQLENGEKLTVKDIENLKKLDAEKQKRLDAVQNELNQTQRHLNQIATQREELEQSLAKKEIELDALVKEGGINAVIEQKTDELKTEIAEMQQQQDNLTNTITRLNADIDAKVQKKLDIERAKHSREFEELDQQNRNLKSQNETLETVLNQRNSVKTENENYQNAAKTLIDALFNARKALATANTSQGAKPEDRTIELLLSAAKECQALAEQITALANEKKLLNGVVSDMSKTLNDSDLDNIDVAYHDLGDFFIKWAKWSLENKGYVMENYDWWFSRLHEEKSKKIQQHKAIFKAVWDRYAFEIQNIGN